MGGDPNLDNDEAVVAAPDWNVFWDVLLGNTLS
jgi:hypothetical protein